MNNSKNQNNEVENNEVQEIITQFEKLNNGFNELEKKIHTLNIQVENEPLTVKKEIDNILEQNENIIEGFSTKIELLKVKAKAFINLGDLEESEQIFNEIEKYIEEKINYSDDENFNNDLKQKEKLELLTEKLELFAKNAWLVFDKNDKDELIINDDKVKKIEGIFGKDAEELEKLGKIDIAIYNMGMFFYNISENEKSIELIESAALLGHEKAIDFYTDFLINYFIGNYNILEKEEEKKEFIEKNLDYFEQSLFQFVDDNNFEQNGERKKLIQGGHKYLYEKIGDFYSKIGLFSESLSSYTSGIQSSFPGNHKLYKNIAELYENYKHKIKTFNITNIDELVKDNYKYLYNRAFLVNDLENIVYGLEKLGDIEKQSDSISSQKYYYKALSKIIENNATDKFSYISIARLMEKLSLNELLLKYPDGNMLIKLESLYREIALKYDGKYLISLAYYYEKNGDILGAFQNYLNAFQSNIPESKDALLIFIETNLVTFIDKEASKYNLELEKDNNILEESEINYAKELNLDELMIKKQLIKKIIEEIDESGEIGIEQIATLFDMSLGDDFYNNFEYKQLLIFIESYNQGINNADIYLHRVLENIFSGNGTNMNDSSIKDLLRKIYTKKELSKSDIQGIYDILHLENQDNPNDFEYTQKLIEIQKKSKK